MTLLPLNATPKERSIESATARVGDVPVPLKSLWNADTCDVLLLPWLAWSLGVVGWDGAWSEEAKRNTIKASVLIKKHNGTVWAIKRIISAAGYGKSILFEGSSNNIYSGASTHNGVIKYGDPTEWATYRVLLERPITNAQAEQIRRLAKEAAPARCKFAELIFSEVAYTYAGTIKYDGTYNYGVA